MERFFGKTKVTTVTGDLTNQPDLDVIVNAANDRLGGGRGVCGAIFKAANWQAMQGYCNQYPSDINGVRCPTGSAVITPSGKLPNKAVIHAVGPIYTDQPLWPNQMAEELHNSYTASLALADQGCYESVGFPAISCGIYHYPIEEAAQVALTAVKAYLKEHAYCLKEVRFVFLDTNDGPIIQAAFEKALLNL